MALINTTTTGVLGSTFFGDGTGSLTIQQNGVTLGVYGSQPAFSAKLAADQTGISNATWTKLAISTEQFDTANCFDTTTYRFTPNVAGYYLLTASVGSAAALSGQMIGSIYRNGSSYFVFAQSDARNVNHSYSGSIIVYMNGTTDYVEVYGYLDGSGTRTFQSESGIKGYFTGCLMRAA